VDFDYPAVAELVEEGGGQDVEWERIMGGVDLGRKPVDRDRRVERTSCSICLWMWSLTP
jgi:hypothetical protein